MSQSTMQHNQTELTIAVMPELTLLDQIIGQSGSCHFPTGRATRVCV